MAGEERCSTSGWLHDLFADFGRADEDLIHVWLSLRCSLTSMTLTPVVANRIGKQLTIFGEVSCSERRWELLRCLVLGLGVLVPDDDGALATERGKRVVRRVERDAIDCVDVGALLLFLLLAMTLEAEVRVFALIGHAEVVVLDATAALDRADCVALAVAEDADRSRGKFEWRVGHLLRVPVVRLEVLGEVPDVDEAVLVSRDEQGPLAAHVVHWHCHICLACLLEGAVRLPGPELDSRVPAARDNC